MPCKQDEINNYRLFVRRLSETHSDRIFLNSDEDHALAVMETLIRQSQSVLRIFAGNLMHVGNQPEYIEAISDFVERGGKVKIILNKCDDDDIKASNLFRRLAYYMMSNKDIVIKRTKVQPYFKSDINKTPIHFSVGDNNAYRVETDIENRVAECSMNNPTRAKTFIQYFDSLFDSDKCKEYNIIDIYDNNAVE